MSCGFESNNHVAYFVQSLKRSTQLRSTVAVTYSGLQPSGDSGTGKTTSIMAALSLFGIHTLFSMGTNAGLLERSARSTIPFGVDDPNETSSTNKLDIGELCVDLYNGQKTINCRSGCCKPLSTAIVATNFGPKPHAR